MYHDVYVFQYFVEVLFQKSCRSCVKVATENQPTNSPVIAEQIFCQIYEHLHWSVGHVLCLPDKMHSLNKYFVKFMNIPTGQCGREPLDP